MCIHYSAIRQPAPDPEQAVLTLIGAVRAPRVLSLAGLRELPQTTRRLTLVCAAVSPHPKHWRTREWSGVPLAALLDAVGAGADVQSAEVAGYDGVRTRFSRADLSGALLALDADGRPLSAEDGFPARLLIPGQPACAMPRFVQRITFRSEPAPARAAATPLAMMDAVDSVEGGVRLRGRALNTDAVFVRLDGGPRVPVAVAAALPGVAAEWALDWPGLSARQASFVVEALPDSDENGERPLARRRKPRHPIWTPTRSERR